MATRVDDRSETTGVRVLARILPALGALVYPLFLRSAYGSMQLISGGGGEINAIGMTCAYVASLSAAYAVPITAALCARHFSRVVPLTNDARRTVRLSHLAFAAPPLYTALGVVTYTLGVGDLDLAVWVAFWAMAAGYSASGHSVTLQHPVSEAAGGLRKFHGIVALTILLGFLLAHLANHVLALWSPDLHGRVMTTLETFYRNALVEPGLVLLMASLLASGIALMWKHTAASQDGFATLQTLTGIYMAVFVTSHLTAVFVMARWLEHIPTDWNFASGAPAGLLKDAWNVRLVPHYSIAVWAVITHVGLGACGIMRSHGAPARTADALARGMIGLGAIVSVLITTALLGVHLHSS